MAKPDRISNLSLKREGNVIKASWKNPSNKGSSIDTRWQFDRTGVTPTEVEIWHSNRGSEKPITYTAADRFWSRGSERLSSYPSSMDKNYDRSRFHPVAYGKYCKTAWMGAAGYSGGFAPWTWASYNFGLPRAPKVSWAYNADTHVATVTVETNEGKDQYERYDTMVMVKFRKDDGKESVLLNWASTKSTKWQRSWDISSYVMNLQTGKYVSIRCWAYARGMAGDNPSAAKAVYAERNVAFPSAPALGKPTCDKKAAGGRIKVPVNKTGWWVTAQLQRKNGDGNWSDVSGATDNLGSENISLYDSYGDANPQPGEYVYYRVKITRDNFTNYSAAVRADCIYTAKPKETCSATCKIASLTSNASGTQVSVVMAWKDSTSNSGCELSWSQYPNGWNTSEEPNVEQVTGHDSTSKLKGWTTRTFSISGLTPGTDYWVRMRRYKTYASGTKYSAYDLSGKATKITTESAEDDRCGILSVTTNSTGTTATVIIGVNEDNANTGTELSWSETKGAWTSDTETPSTADVTSALVVVTDATWKKTWKKQHTATISNLTPGMTYYIRARRYNAPDGGTATYSPYSAIGSIRMESATDDTCEIDAVPQSGGTICKLSVTPHEDNRNTGTVIQWTDYSHGWYTNDSPNEMTASWGLSNGVQTVWLKGLLPGTQYWVRARRYLESGGTTTYGTWSKTKTFTTRRDTAVNDRVGIVSCTPDSSGTGATLVIGYTEDNANVATEISWSSDSAAWSSNQGPSTMEADWSDSKSKSASWKKTQTVYLRGLELGTTYFVKARRYNEDESGRTWTPYSGRVSFTTPAKRENADARCGLVSVDVVNGTTIKAVIGWSGDHSGCEVTWSDDPNAWESSEAPSSFEFDWADATRQSSSWSKTGTCYIKGLTEGTTYYVRARSFYDGDARVWSAYSSDEAVTPFSAPDAVVLEAPASIARGKAIECWWEISGDMPQTEWHMHDASAPKKAIAEGTGSLCHASIGPDKYVNADTISIYVEAGCGGGLTRSDTAVVAIADVPECEALCAETLTAQPASFEVLTNDPSARLLATCYSRGCTLAAPDGNFDQLDGDAVWTQALVPQWSEMAWSETDSYARISAEIDDAADAVDAAEAAFAESEGYAALQQAIEDLEDAEAALQSAEEDVAAARSALETAEAALAAAQAVLDELTPEDEGYAEAVAAVEAAEAAVEDAQDDVEEAEGDLSAAQEGRTDAIDAHIAAYDAAYASDEGVAMQDAEAALEAATAALAAHEPSDTVFAATVQMPASDLYDGGMYYAEFRTVENVAGLVSEPAIAEFSVEYAHQAPEPSEQIAVVPDAEGRKVVLTLTAPSGAEGTDVYDIYRQTPAGYELVAYGKGLGDEITDPYAPYGHADTAYRIACRTEDGDIAWASFGYSMPVRVLRFDWDGNSLELPWNIEIRESMGKDYENRRHVDGTMNGYWDRGVEFSGSYTTEIIKVNDAELLRRAREVGSYPGAVWVRDGHGKAMQCNVDLNETSISYKSKAVGLSFSFTAMKTTDQFMPMGTEETEPDNG